MCPRGRPRWVGEEGAQDGWRIAGGALLPPLSLVERLLGPVIPFHSVQPGLTRPPSPKAGLSCRCGGVPAPGATSL